MWTRRAWWGETVAAILTACCAAGLSAGEGPAINPARNGLAQWQEPPKVVSPYAADWGDYRALLWHEPSGIDRAKWPLFFQRLREMNFIGGMAYSDNDPTPWAEARLPYYRTNICNLLYIRNKSYGKKLSALKKSRTHELLHRDPSLEDPETLAGELRRCETISAMDKATRPLAYDLRDEASYTAFAAPVEFDFSPVSLAAFREWLKTQYADLAALNRQWETDFASWDAAMPFTVNETRERELKRLERCNLSPLADHRAYNDFIWCKTLRAYAAKIHENDPGAPVGISGTQMPSAWGGFNFDLLGKTLTWVEHYDDCGSREIIRGLFPEHTPAIAATSHANTTDDTLRMWYNLLHGDAGGLVWPFKGNDLALGSLLAEMRTDGWPLTPRGRNIAATFAEARCGLAPLLRAGRFQTDPVAILYHQPSIRADWFFEVKRDAASWVHRSSSFESEHNYMATGRVGMHKLLEDLGYQYAYARPDDLLGDALAARGIRVLILPRNLCLSDAEAAGLRRFVEGGGVLLTDLMAGRMDEHCRVRSADGLKAVNDLLGVERAAFAFQEETKPEAKGSGYEGGYGTALKLAMLDDFGPLKKGQSVEIQGFQEPGLKAAKGAIAHATSPAGDALIVRALGKGKVVTLNFDIPNYEVERTGSDRESRPAAARAILRHVLEGVAGIVPPVKVVASGPDHPVGAELIRYRDGDAEYLAVINNRNVQIDWATLADTALERERKARAEPYLVTIRLPKPMHAFEVRLRKALGRVDTIQAELTPHRPIILALLPYAVAKLDAGGGEGKLTKEGHLPVKLSVVAGGARPGNHVVHCELRDAKGGPVPEGVVNVPLPGGRYEGAIDLSHVAGPGPWTLRLRDVASAAEAEIKVSR